MSEEQFREQLVDYLYGELDDARRAAFEKELEQPSRRAELEAMRATLRTARTGLAALEEEPPARLRGVLLDAEQAERASKVVRPWYRRASTITPALAAAAALTFAVLAPRRDEQPRLDREQAAPASEPAPAAPAPVAAEPAEKEIADEAVESKGKLAAPAEKKRDERPRRESRGAAKPTDDEGAGYAQPPPGWGSVGRSGGGGAVRERAMQADKAEEAPASLGAPAMEESASSSELRSRAQAAPKAAAPAPSGGVAEGATPAKREAAKSSTASTQRAPDELVERARAHAEARRWSEAVIAYRELLQRFPKDDRAARWRSELGSAARALTAVPLVP